MLTMWCDFGVLGLLTINVLFPDNSEVYFGSCFTSHEPKACVTYRIRRAAFRKLLTISTS